jgi:hypothetical protein
MSDILALSIVVRDLHHNSMVVIFATVFEYRVNLRVVP